MFDPPVAVCSSVPWSVVVVVSVVVVGFPSGFLLWVMALCGGWGVECSTPLFLWVFGGGFGDVCWLPGFGLVWLGVALVGGSGVSIGGFGEARFRARRLRCGWGSVGAFACWCRAGVVCGFVVPCRRLWCLAGVVVVVA